MYNLSSTIAGINFKNPIISASGTFGFGSEYNKFYDVSILGAIIGKGITLNPREGNFGMRMMETASGMLNSVGLQNPGVDGFIKNELPKMKKFDTNIIANLGGDNLEEYIEGAKKLNKTNIDILELNISCPNVKKGGASFGMDPDSAYNIVCEIKKAFSKPLMVKLTPNAPDIVEIAKSCEKGGADILSLVNTFTGMSIDINTAKPMFNNIVAGLSGPCIKPIALRMIYDVYKNVDIPIIGIGGIACAYDVIEFILAGASAVQIGCANFSNPLLMPQIIEDLKKYMKEKKIENLHTITGLAHK